MDDGLNYPMSIEDGMSGPARDEVSALRALESQIKATEKSMRALQGEQLNYKRAGFKGAAGDVALDIAKVKHELGGLKGEYSALSEQERAAAQGASKIAKEQAAQAKAQERAAAQQARAHKYAIDHAPESFGEQLSSSLFGSVTAATLLAGAIMKVGQEALAAAEYVGDLAISATKFAIEAAQFREDTTLAYAVVKGTAEEGEKTFSQIDKIAEQAHMPAEKAHGLARDLMLQGLTDTRLIGETIEAQAALMRTGQIQGAEKLTKIIERSTASGHFDPGKLGGGKGGATSGRALAGLGVSLPDLISQIANDTHKSIGEVQSELKAGSIGIEAGVTALTESINKGVIGQTARAKYDIHDFTTDAENYFRRMVDGINLKPLEQGLLDVSTALGFVADHKGGVEAVFQTIVDWAGKAIEKGVEFGEDAAIWFLEAELAAAPLIKMFQDLVGLEERTLDGFHNLTGIKASYLIPGVGGVLQGMDIESKKLGANMGNDLISGARAATHTHSPSEDMKDFGRDLRSGLDIGFNADTIGRTVSAGIQPQSGGGDTSSSVTNHFDVGGVHVHGGDSPHATAALLESQIADIFERFALEMGR